MFRYFNAILVSIDLNSANQEILNLKNDTVLVYMATPYFGDPTVYRGWMKKCPDHIKKLKEFEHTFKRNREVPYVMMTQECPFYAYLDEYRHFFNWTMTYRRDSDVFYPYGAILRNEETIHTDYGQLFRSKSKVALWLVSNEKNTNNRRKELVEKLVAKGMSIDLMGALYQKSPPNCYLEGVDYEKCESELHSPYKFYIAFENNNCKDYVTEKFWRKSLRYKIIPIVMTRNIYRDLKIPDSMYIAVDDFSSLEDFIKHVKNVSENEEEFKKYHEWRENYRVVDFNEGNNGFCQLCEKVKHYENSKRMQKSYEDLKEWNHEQLQCDNSFVDRYV